jgi:hypothetical protein
MPNSAVGKDRISGSEPSANGDVPIVAWAGIENIPAAAMTNTSSAIRRLPDI